MGAVSWLLGAGGYVLNFRGVPYPRLKYKRTGGKLLYMMRGLFFFSFSRVPCRPSSPAFYSLHEREDSIDRQIRLLRRGAGSPLMSFTQSFDEEPAVVLLVLPDEELRLEPDGQGLLSLHNLSPASCIAFLVSATDTDVQVTPADGVLPPGKQVHVRVQLTASGTPERILVRYTLLPQNLRSLQVREHLDGLRDRWGSDSRHCQHMLRTSRNKEPSSKSSALELARAVTGGSGISLRERLAAAERLAILRSTQLLKAEQRIVQLESEGATSLGSLGHAFVQTHGNEPGGRIVRSLNAKLSLLLSHTLVGLAALITGALYSDILIGA